ncbi:Mov34-domain-containing protein [Lentinus tigrinus ALCF2SS1-7]|nr:Mov34-domain-containing protein [Lentinus tigrinus ALCF2SS1-7]
MPVPESHKPPATYTHSHTQSYSSQRGPSPRPSQPPQHRPSGSTSNSRIVPGSSKDVQLLDLRTIKLPRDCLPKFLSIARVNTLQNRETCGLLLGKDKGSKYVVTTLLIPKQHSTSDTCMMDEEELVLQFTEERHLITLGWIHTHPTQSCFMSSVDLHTHSGFQRMLPESFAVVCAPSSTPQFGIFRLTDPGGLQTVLECNAKEAFHPHPDVPIYTDCDNSHVQMKDLPLEIVDLRG